MLGERRDAQLREDVEETQFAVSKTECKYRRIRMVFSSPSIKLRGDYQNAEACLRYGFVSCFVGFFK